MIILPVTSHTTCYESYYLLRVLPSITVLKHSTMLQKYGYHDLDGGRGVFPHHCQVMIIPPVTSHTTCYESYYLLRVIPSITALNHSTMLKKYGYHDLDGGWGGVSSPLSGDDYTTCYESYYLLRVILPVTSHTTCYESYPLLQS